MTKQKPVQNIPVLHFFLMPDRTSARRARRLVAEQGGAVNLMVGTWRELLDQAQKAYLRPDPPMTWDERLNAAAANIPDAFWSASLQVAAEETLAVLSDNLCKLLEGAGVTGRLQVPLEGSLSARAFRHLADLARLHEAMEYALPWELDLVSGVLASGKERAVRAISVYWTKMGMRLNPWQTDLVRKLSENAGGRTHDLEKLYNLVSAPLNAGKGGTSLAILQKGLFGKETSQAPLDTTVQFLAVRDFLEEIEVAAGMVQKALADDPKLTCAEIGMLIPWDQIYADALRNVFGYAGLPLSGLTVDKVSRDLGREAVLYFLLTRRRPAPAMALASLLSSPLMPWTVEEGNALAQRVMNGDFGLEPPERFPVDCKRMLRAIRQDADTVPSMAAALTQYSSLLRGVEGMEGHLARAKETIGKAVERLGRSGDIPWAELLRIASSGQVSSPSSGTLNREGMAVFTEHEEPWREVKLLFVLGFGNGRYPSDPTRSSVFSDADLEAISQKAGYCIETPEGSARRSRDLFRRQLGAATQRINFLIPRRDFFGKELRPSQSLTFMAKLFNMDSPESLVLELERGEDRSRIAGLAASENGEPSTPRALKKQDLSLKRNLLAIHCYHDGSPKPQSPSSLETLMASPFAWLLGRAGLQPLEWAPETLDVASKGTLAHDVFEHLFQPAKPLPKSDEIKAKTAPLLHQAITRKMPFLLAPEWHVERRHLQREIEIAALRWKELLEEMGAKVLGNEVWLRGLLDTLPIHGSADLLIELPKSRLYVVDYKKASSGPRRDRMALGFDSQASLYRMMIETGGSGKNDDSALQKTLKSAKEISVAYYMMNDQVALADSKGWVGKKVAGLEEVGGGISDNAMDLIRQRIDELKAGIVKLNQEDDPEWFDKNAAMTIYALDNSPLLTLFMKPPPPVVDAAAVPEAGKAKGKGVAK